MLRFSGMAGDYESLRLSQKFRSLFEQIKLRGRLPDQQLGLRPRTLNPENGHESGLPGCCVSADRFAGLRRRAFDIEQIIGNLEGKSEVVGVAAQRGSDFCGRLGENRS